MDIKNKNQAEKIRSAKSKDGRTLELWKFWSLRVWMYELGIQGGIWERLHNDLDFNFINKKFEDHINEQ
jgi:hypothetical protein